MTTARTRPMTRAAAVATLLFGVLPFVRLEAQAAVVTAPKQAAQRAAAASNAQLQAQVSQVQSGPQRAPQGAGGRSGVVQSGTPAPDPGARAAGAAATPAPDPSNAIMREVFQYAVQGRRDPFFSLMATGDLRPMLSDLKLTTILYDLSGRRPVAVMNDVSTNVQYRVTIGMMLGRMRVTRITPRKVIFAIEEFGFSRADSLVLADKSQTRK
ncbi:MAG: hypothetical protein ABR499_02525 [Gemmatimonadaceae bacterium]